MFAAIRLLLIPLLVACASPAWAQSKTSEPQPMAKPGESTEPPKPRAAPIGVVQAVPLPRGGGILVFGGTRGTGLEVVKELVARKEQVTVVTTGSTDNPTLKELGVSVVSGNALDPKSIEEALKTAAFRAVISTVGQRRGEPSPDYEGNRNIIDATKAAGIERFVFVTVIGAGDSAEAPPWLARWFLKDIIAAKTKAEDHLKASGLAYTIVRPGGLLDKPASGQAVLKEDPATFSWIARADLGKLVAGVVFDDTTIGKVYSAYDPTRTSMFSLFGS
jgi:uncharacterized protein YbjT (DUF2867 family)